MLARSWTFQKAQFWNVADFLALGLVASLPWSTSGTGFFAALWLVCLLPLLSYRDLLAEAVKCRSASAVALLAMMGLATLWSIGTPRDQFLAVGSYAKLGILPFLILHFQARQALAAKALRLFLISVTVLLALSYFTLHYPFPPSRFLAMLAPGVPVKDWISQSHFFIFAAFALAHISGNFFERGKWKPALAILLLALLFIANLMHVHPSRTSLFILPSLVLLLVIQRLGFKRGVMIGLLVASLGGAFLWAASEQIRGRLTSAFTEVETYSNSREANSAGYRLEWYQRSAELLAASPLLGYGAGGVRAAFERAADEGRLPRAFVTPNPHNQSLSTALQTGLFGTALLIAMWASHVIGLWHSSLAGRLGMGIALLNIGGGFFNSHLSDFTQGWFYVVGIGAALAAAQHWPQKSEAKG